MTIIIPLIDEHQYELKDSVAAKFHEEPGVFKLMVCVNEKDNKMHVPTVFAKVIVPTSPTGFQLFLHFYKVKTKVCIGPSGSYSHSLSMRHRY